MFPISISIDQTYVMGGTQSQLTATLTYDDGTTKTLSTQVEWKLYSSTYASVSTNGWITAASVTQQHSTTLYATYYDSEYDVTLYASEMLYIRAQPVIKLTGLSISGPTTVNKNTTQTYLFYGTYNNGTTALVTPVSVYTNRPAYVTFTTAGIATYGQFHGTTPVTLYATVQDAYGTFSATLAVTVRDSAIYPTSAEIIGPDVVVPGQYVYKMLVYFADLSVRYVIPTWYGARPSAHGVLSLENDTFLTGVFSVDGFPVTATKSISVVDVKDVVAGFEVEIPDLHYGRTYTFATFLVYTSGRKVLVPATLQVDGIYAENFVAMSDAVLTFDYGDFSYTQQVSVIQHGDVVRLSLEGPDSGYSASILRYTAVATFEDGASYPVAADVWTNCPFLMQPAGPHSFYVSPFLNNSLVRLYARFANIVTNMDVLLTSPEYSVESIDILPVVAQQSQPLVLGANAYCSDGVVRPVEPLWFVDGKQIDNSDSCVYVKGEHSVMALFGTKSATALLEVE